MCVELVAKVSSNAADDQIYRLRDQSLSIVSSARQFSRLFQLRFEKTRYSITRGTGFRGFTHYRIIVER